MLSGEEELIVSLFARRSDVELFYVHVLLLHVLEVDY